WQTRNGGSSSPASSAPHHRATPVTRIRRFLFAIPTSVYPASRVGLASPGRLTRVLFQLQRGGARQFENPNRGNGRRRVGQADPPMRENRQVFPHNYVRFMTSRSICATARVVTSSSGDFACRSANSSWRSSE